MPEKTQTVLIGTTLNPAGDPFVAAGIHLARSMGAKVHLAHAYDLPLIYGGAPFVAEIPVGELVDAERRAVQERMDLQIQRLGLGADELAGTTLDLGAAHRVLIEAAERSDSCLIVMGAVESHGALDRLFGSTSDRVVRKADCPVLLVRGELQVPPARVLLPVDLSDLSAEAFRQGLALLDRIGGSRQAELEVLYVRTEVDGHPVHRVEGVSAAARVSAASDLAIFLAREESGAGWRLTPRVEFGFVDSEILARIEEWRPNLVLLGTHGRGGFERFLLGSVTTRLLRESGANLLVIPPAAARAGMSVHREQVAA
jgi:universal stress protein E